MELQPSPDAVRSRETKQGNSNEAKPPAIRLWRADLCHSRGSPLKPTRYDSQKLPKGDAKKTGESNQFTILNREYPTYII